MSAPRKSWQEVAAETAEETNPDRIIELAKELDQLLEAAGCPPAISVNAQSDRVAVNRRSD